MTTRALAAALSGLAFVACIVPQTERGEETEEVDAGLPDVEVDPFRPPEAVDLDPSRDVLEVELVARPDVVDVDGFPTAVFAYNGSVPGPTLRLPVGGTLVVTLRNELDDDTTIHWHGIDAPWAMDGAPWMQEPVAPGETFRYEVPVSRAGTFWYHPHFDTARQVDLGLYGAVIVEDPAAPSPDHELILFLDDWAEEARAGAPVDGERRLLVNGHREPLFVVEETGIARVRVINASNSAYSDLSWPSMRRIGSDQGILPAVDESARTLLAPGDRADFEWLLGASGFDVESLPYSVAGAGQGPADILVRVEAPDEPPPPPLTWPSPDALEPSPLPGASDLLYVLAGDDSTGQWRINGESYPDVTVGEVALDDDVIITVRNLSPTEHPFHIHGHRFEVLSIGDVVPPFRTIEDTINVPVFQDVVLRMSADNPGEWMVHCHILPHAEGGMMTVLRVAP